MKQYDKLIFVSGSDTSTSPMAEAILQNLFLLEDILIDSKGLVVLFPEPLEPTTAMNSPASCPQRHEHEGAHQRTAGRGRF